MALLPLITVKNDTTDTTVAEALIALKSGRAWPVIKGWLEGSATAQAMALLVLDEREFRQGQGQGQMLLSIIDAVEKAADELQAFRDRESTRKGWE